MRGRGSAGERETGEAVMDSNYASLAGDLTVETPERLIELLMMLAKQVHAPADLIDEVKSELLRRCNH